MSDYLELGSSCKLIEGEALNVCTADDVSANSIDNDSDKLQENDHDNVSNQKDIADHRENVELTKSENSQKQNKEESNTRSCPVSGKTGKCPMTCNMPSKCCFSSCKAMKNLLQFPTQYSESKCPFNIFTNYLYSKAKVNQGSLRSNSILAFANITAHPCTRKLIMLTLILSIGMVFGRLTHPEVNYNPSSIEQRAISHYPIGRITKAKDRIKALKTIIPPESRPSSCFLKDRVERELKDKQLYDEVEQRNTRFPYTLGKGIWMTPRVTAHYPPQPLYVIIPYKNEQFRHFFWSIQSLLKAIEQDASRESAARSVILQKIVIVDDNNDPANDFLPEWMQIDPRILSIRCTYKNGDCGIVRSRVFAMEYINNLPDITKNDLIFFTEPHTLCNPEFLKPLVDVVYFNRTATAVPSLDIILDTEFKKYQAGIAQIGGFDYTLAFHWREHVLERQSDWSPPQNFTTPVNSGGIFLINRSYFTELGLYDRNLDIWGAENLELSFKTWLAGGSIITVYCSKVGHMFRESHDQPYDVDFDIVLKNRDRVAKIWLEEYYKDFLASDKRVKSNLKYKDIKDQLYLKKKILKTRPFTDFITHIYPELATQPRTLQKKYKIPQSVLNILQNESK